MRLFSKEGEKMGVNKEPQESSVALLGKILISGKIVCETGLRIGGPKEALEIGGLENIIVRDSVTNFPYIPGSSLKGKMRSLLEKAQGKPLTDKENEIHVCKNSNDYMKCEVCRIFGVPASDEIKDQVTLTRLYVRDASLSEESEKRLRDLDTESPYAEVKWENVISRITSRANPRQVERIPAGTEFNFEIVYNIFDENDLEFLRYVFKAMKLVEDDYLGGYGSRGYGKVKFKGIRVILNDIVKVYEKGELGEELRKEKNVDDLLKDGKLIEEIKEKLNKSKA
jgi:CRISPR-associated protein Csm3